MTTSMCVCYCKPVVVGDVGRDAGTAAAAAAAAAVGTHDAAATNAAGAAGVAADQSQAQHKKVAKTILALQYQKQHLQCQNHHQLHHNPRPQHQGVDSATASCGWQCSAWHDRDKAECCSSSSSSSSNYSRCP